MINYIVVDKENFRPDSISNIDFLSLVCYFGGDRWSCIDKIIIAKDDEIIIGLGSLSKEGEDYNGEPEIVGLWVNESYRGREIGKNMLIKLTEECRKLYNKEPSVMFVSDDGARLIGTAKNLNIKYLNLAERKVKD